MENINYIALFLKYIYPHRVKGSYNIPFSGKIVYRAL